ncbi:MAG TPA: nuclear transport factor 2 family protein [Solirubrobacteraceae bacterium]|nr:nuclear transport factor 2 family protein [Solirubrobacteraceae bacterium]
MDLIRARFEVFARTGEFDRDAYDSDVTWHLREDLPDSETLVGRDRVGQFFSQWAGTFEKHRIDVEELIDAGEHVVAVLRFRITIQGSGQEIDMPESWVIKLADGAVIEGWEYKTKAEALKAAGLEE